MSSCSYLALGANEPKYLATKYRAWGVNLRSVLCVVCLSYASALCVLLFADISIASPYFRDTGLMDIPTAYLTGQGIFTVSAHTAVKNRKREELALRIDFGMFNLAELGLIGLKKEDHDYILGNMKLMLSRESGYIPGLSVGIDNLGEKAPNSAFKGYKRSIYGVISKQFNLPVLQLVNGHIGIGNGRYISDANIGKYLHGMFIGMDKDIALLSLDSHLQIMWELMGKDLNAGLKYMMNSGLSINIAIGQLNSGARDFVYYLGIGFTNALMMKEIAQSSELAKRAVRIVNEAYPDVDRKK